MRHSFDISLKLSEILRAIGLPFDLFPEQSIYFFTDHSGEAESGDLFFSLAAEKEEARRYNREALQKHAFVITEETGAGLLSVPDVFLALSAVAKLYLSKLLRLQAKIAVTGSVGKTTLKEALSCILSRKFKTHKTQGNRNNRVGLPFTILSAPKDTELLILEMGMNSAGEIAELSRCVCPDIAVITCVGTAHIGLLGSRKKIAEAKKEVCIGMHGGTVFLPGNEPLLNDLPNAVKVSVGNRKGDYAFFPDTDLPFSCQGRFVKPNGQSFSLECPVGGVAGAWAIAFGAAIADFLGCSEDCIRSGLRQYLPAAMRQNVFILPCFRLIEDCYNASPESCAEAIRTISHFRQPRAVLFGDMLELGMYGEKEHVRLGYRLAECQPFAVFYKGEFSQTVSDAVVRAGFSKNRFFSLNKLSDEEAAAEIRAALPPGTTLLVKASRGVHLETITARLKAGFVPDRKR